MTTGTTRRKLKWATHADLAIERQPSVGREEFLDHMTFRTNDRPLFTEIFGPIVGLKEEWEEQGATAAELDFSAFRYRCEERARLSLNTGLLGGHEPVTLEETDEFIVTRDRLGRTMKMPKGLATLPLPLSHPVATMDDWLTIKSWYEYDDARLSAGWVEAARAHAEAGRVVCVGMPGGFDEPRQLMGEEEICVSYYAQPEMLHDMLQTMGDTAVRILEQVAAAGVTVDLLSVHEDMAGKSGPLAGPAQIAEFIAPYYRRVWEVAQECGARLFDQDSDGDMMPVIPAFLEAGVNCMHPMEPAAGMDIVAVRETYGDRLAFYGGLDKHVIRGSTEQITTELERKVPPMIASGGCVLGLDHRIPNGTPLANYRFYLEKMWEILER
ncbi:MAG TPA: uroporphyrinogen decarboxylase family protein [Candidatus Latescibacteria bacterium]|jgi:uroporphyrinogen-III decarboxylase|nr:uroporphyrinogen decarboxylase family protein [Candidatus Latescibacterota bacterium]HJP33044.1 uroporphyrinogen decarboxylase family protein [Candidatus Latescibacterota bacterium]